MAATVLAVIGGDRGYDWYSSRCSTAGEVYPELGWLLVILPLALAGVLCGAGALWLELRRRPPETWIPLALLAMAALLGGGAAVLSGFQLLDPCGAAG